VIHFILQDRHEVLFVQKHHPCLDAALIYYRLKLNYPESVLHDLNLI